MFMKSPSLIKCSWKLPFNATAYLYDKFSFHISPRIFYKMSGSINPSNKCGSNDSYQRHYWRDRGLNPEFHISPHLNVRV
jgi:hypothetical protein